MELVALDLLGETALELNPRALRGDPDRRRARVACRAGVVEAELRSFLGDDLRLASSAGAGLLAEFSLARPAGANPPSSARARVLLAAALARATAPRPPRLLAVLNVTPDSFSDGGRWNDPARAVERGLELVTQGAHALDIGGESSRPGSLPVDLEEERRRVLPVIRELALQTKVPISVDTTKARLAAEAIDLGATMVNDISAGRFDPEMIPLVARRGCSLALMHMQGTPADMQDAPRYADVVDEVLAFLRERASAAWRAGIPLERLWVDPGIGFGKTLEHNLQLLARLGELRSLGIPLLVGPSRKSFIATIHAREGSAEQAGEPSAKERIGGTAAAICACVHGGAVLLRVHDVPVMAEAMRVARAIAAQ